MTGSDAAEYGERFPALVRVAEQLAAFIRAKLADVPRVDRVSARAKTPESFKAKAEKAGASGEPRYEAPLVQVQDQIGARVIVFYKSDVSRVATVLKSYLQPLESKVHTPESNWEFGYFGAHWILALPLDAIPEDIEIDVTPRFFELQIKTLFQHAWSEANHDLGYKADVTPSGDQERRLAFTAAQAWGADRVFDELHLELRPLTCCFCKVAVEEVRSEDESINDKVTCPSCGDSMPLDVAVRTAREESLAREIVGDVDRFFGETGQRSQATDDDELDGASSARPRFRYGERRTG